MLYQKYLSSAFLTLVPSVRVYGNGYLTTKKTTLLVLQHKNNKPERVHIWCRSLCSLTDVQKFFKNTNTHLVQTQLAVIGFETTIELEYWIEKISVDGVLESSIISVYCFSPHECRCTNNTTHQNLSICRRPPDIIEFQ